MENKRDIWLEDLLLEPKLSGTEKIWRNIYRICDEFYLLLRFLKYPLTSERQEYVITIYGSDKLGWNKVLVTVKGMEIDKVLKEVKKFLENYKVNHKEYNLRKPGGGEMI